RSAAGADPGLLPRGPRRALGAWRCARVGAQERMSVDGIATIRYLTTTSFGFGASSLLEKVLGELAIARPLVVTDPGVRAAGVARHGGRGRARRDDQRRGAQARLHEPAPVPGARPLRS